MKANTHTELAKELQILSADISVQQTAMRATCTL